MGYPRGKKRGTLDDARFACRLAGAFADRMRLGRSEPRESIATVAAKVETRDLAAQVTSMEVLPYSAGAIIRATGEMPTQGWWDAELVALPVDENGVLVYEFRVFPPLTDTPAGTAQSREVTVAVSISPQKLDGVSEIVVQGATNARSSRR